MIVKHTRKVNPIKSKKDIERIISYLDYKIQTASPRTIKAWKRNKFLFIFGINSALRISDILDIRVRDIEKGYLQLKDKKTNKWNNIELNKKVLNMSLQYIEDVSLTYDDYIFNNFKYLKVNGEKTDTMLNEHISYSAVNKLFKQIENDLELNYNINSHTLRKTYGFHYYQQTKDIYALMHILNHSDVKVTQRYIGLYDDEKNKSRKGFSIGI